ncbi:MAG: Fe2+-dependent dioxygenase [Gammaproteobacteria bacterium]|nr:Fe2+-dependent dioxygenase [Gammaproteobacteria bacterium]
MHLAITNILPRDRLTALQSLLAEPDIFIAGDSTAGSAAAAVKHNQQAAPQHPEVKGALQLIEQLLARHSVFQAAARPARFARLQFSRYGVGMAYGLHNDGALIDGVRTDLSFTLFLSAPDSYDGGALLLHDAAGVESVKLAAGDLILYPSGCLHEVNRVTRGVRLAVVGWLQSRIRRADQRELLFNLDSVLSQLPESNDNTDCRLRLQQVRGGLLRMWLD